MKITEMSVGRKEATQKWKESIKSYRETKDPVYKDMRNVYNAIKNGQKIIDIYDVIKQGGASEKGHPQLAIASARLKIVQCRYQQNGTVQFNPWGGIFKVEIKDCLPVIHGISTWQGYNLETAVPIIPAKLRPKYLMDDLYILWEVIEWKIMPPGDPYLLRRLSPNIFAILGHWDLTDIERAVMTGRL